MKSYTAAKKDGQVRRGLPCGRRLDTDPCRWGGKDQGQARTGTTQTGETQRERGAERERGREKSREGRRTEYLIQLDEYVKETIHNFTRKKCHNKAAEQSKRRQGTGYRQAQSVSDRKGDDPGLMGGWSLA